MKSSATGIAAFLFAVSIAAAAAAQTAESANQGLKRFGVEASAGPLVNSGGGHTLSAAFSFTLLPRLDLAVNVERNHLPFQRETFDGGYSLTRGGTLTSISGELRVSALPQGRVSPYGFAGIGGGVSRPTVNADFPNAVENDLRVVYFGGGLRIPIGRSVNIFGDARGMMALDNSDSLMGLWPIRAGLAWRF